ncbi:DUF4280 domain-containing protein [Chryseobacterium sp. L7]|uniref:DUF4280 domain-containing protein n=1 Tax=Chryseobacterium endalhagicum TaxID=2797638 RepID=A0ABS1QD79_9FLAO|nr:DUF6402 family protein [Chryseobacterium endalhagicum]MBL1220044.1 DUF4280 domain-containing protein [Chryseobacterium endalhagicum]
MEDQNTSAHDRKLSEKRTEKQKKSNEDSPLEKREVVMHGAKLKCPFAQSPGDLKVTSNEINLQDQLWATEGDGNNMVNLQFKGTCGHPKWPAKNMSPPPCMSVIKLSPWENLGTSTVQTQTVLVKESFITCDPDFNAAVAKPIPKVASIKSSIGNDKPAIIAGHWVDKNNQKIKLHPYGDEKLHFFFEANKAAIGKKITFIVYESDSGPINDDNLYEKDYIISSERNNIHFLLTADLFTKGEESILQLYAKIELEGTTYELPQETDYLKIHVVEFVPKIEGALKWTNAKMLQDIWFNGNENDKPWLINPKVDLLSMDWVLSYPRMKTEYDAIITQKWKSENAIKLLKKRIKEMTKNPSVNLKLPKKDNETISFGVSGNVIQTFNNIEQPKLGGQKAQEMMPLFERFYYQSVSYNISKNIFSMEPLDDLFGALASCQFRVIAFGTITRKNKNYLVKITKIGVYIKDSFDFITSDEYLGDWSPKKNGVSVNPYGATADTYYTIENKSYRDWRKDYKKGMDFNLYTDVKYLNVYHEFYATPQEIE